MNLARFREQARRNEAVCCFACGRNTATEDHTIYVNADGTARRFPVCYRCWRIAFLNYPADGIPDPIDEMVAELGRQQAARIQTLRDQGRWPPTILVPRNT